MDSTYAPQSPDGHRPQSPDLSSLGTTFGNYNQSGRFQGTFSSNPFANSILQSPASAFPPTYHQSPTSQLLPTMPPARYKAEHADDDYFPDVPPAKRGRSMKQEGSSILNGQQGLFKAENEVDPTQGCQLKTSFPVARIKRIMQADEDIGKVAQVTPTVVSRALELFMIKLISASAHQARGAAPPGGGAPKGPKRILVQHLKKAVMADKTFDFLESIVEKVPEAPTKAKKEAGSDSEDAKPKKRGKKRKDSGDDF